jgi:diguanylate cyclase (GGDEF)-like protein
MKPARTSKPPGKTSRGKSLTGVLGQGERLKALVDESVEALASVNTSLNREVPGREEAPRIARAVRRNEAIEGKVQEAAEQISAMNKALEQEVTSRHELEEKLVTVTRAEEVARHAAFHDPLTDMPNRALFDDRLEHGLAQSTRHGRALAVMYIDLDNFKAINDVHGHDAGDAVLKAIADRLKGRTRRDDTVSRYGGDEFLYLLMDMGGQQEISLIADKLLDELRKPIPAGTGTLIVNPSIGIAIYPKDGTAASDLIKSADKAMYEAKQGKSGYAFAP